MRGRELESLPGRSGMEGCESQVRREWQTGGENRFDLLDADRFSPAATDLRSQPPATSVLSQKFAAWFSGVGALAPTLSPAFSIGALAPEDMDF